MLAPSKTMVRHMFTYSTNSRVCDRTVGLGALGIVAMPTGLLHVAVTALHALDDFFWVVCTAHLSLLRWCVKT